MAGELGYIDIKALIDAYIKTNGNREITPPLHNIIETALANSNLNKVDGGVLQALAFYSSALAISDPLTLVYKSYVDDLITALEALTQGTNTLTEDLAFDLSTYEFTIKEGADEYFKVETDLISALTNIDLNGNDLLDAGLITLETMRLGVYGSMSETAGGLAYIIGNSIEADPIMANTVLKTSVDTGHFIRTRYDRGISFHTGLEGGIGDSFDDEDNMRLRIYGNGTIEAYGNTRINGVLSSAYDNSNLVEIYSGSDGLITFFAFGSNPRFTFNEDVSVTGKITSSADIEITDNTKSVYIGTKDTSGSVRISKITNGAEISYHDGSSYVPVLSGTI